MLDLDINKEEILKQAVNCVFEKALAEPSFSPTYGDLCKRLDTKLNVKDNKGNVMTFKKIILNRCQAEFEKEEKTIEITEDSTEEEKEQAHKMKQRMLGTIRFIGELFIRAMIKLHIMQYCIQALLVNPDEENIESLCKLLRTVGAKLEKTSPPNELFAKLTELSKSKTLNSRFRFMLQDIIDLRRAGGRSTKWSQG